MSFLLFIVTKNCKQHDMNNNSALNIKESTMLGFLNTPVGQWVWGVEGKQVGSMNEEPQEVAIT